MYLTHFGLRTPPFRLASNVNPLYLSRGQGRASAYLDYTAHSRDGFLLLTGAAGSGKSSLLQKLACALPKSTIVAHLTGRYPTAQALLRGLGLTLGLPVVAADMPSLWRDVRDSLVAAHDGGQRVLLVVDEAQGLGAEAIEELRVLSDLQRGEEKLLRIILSGEPELATTIDAPGQEPLRRRLRLRFELRGLDEDETEGYMEHRLSAAGGPQRLFDPAVHPLIHASARGLPGVINTLCDACLHCACAAGRHRIDAVLVDEALRGLGLEHPTGPEPVTNMHGKPTVDELFGVIDRLTSELSGRMGLIDSRLQAISEELRQLR